MARLSALGVMITCFCLLLQFQFSLSTEFIVGDSSGWSSNSVDWPKGKSFKAGDVLVFKYDPQQHNVVVVDAAGYKSCTAAPGSKTYTSGNDRIALAEGDNYFICSVPGHCEQGMEIAVHAA